MIDGRYGEATLCYFVLDDAGVVDASREHQAAALRKWLSANRPSPPLRTDMRLNGFGYLLDDPHPPSCDGLDTRERSRVVAAARTPDVGGGDCLSAAPRSPSNLSGRCIRSIDIGVTHRADVADFVDEG